jgi:hypothetical protein
MSRRADVKYPDIFGLLAEFDDPQKLVDKTQQAWEAGYRRMDAYTPFPVHGLSDALGLQRNWMPYIVLLGAIIGGVGGYFLQYYAQVIDYPIIVGGRPLNSWPAYMPITFETAVLTAAIMGVLGMLALNGLPMPYHPVFNAPRFELATGDRFFLCIMGTDPKFDPQETQRFLEGLKPQSIHLIEQGATKIYE